MASQKHIQILENMFRFCAIDIRGSCDRHLTSIEFCYDNSYHASIQMAPHETLYEKNADLPFVGMMWVEEKLWMLRLFSKQ